MTNERRYHFSQSLFQSSAPFSHLVIAGGLGQVSGIIGQRRDDGALIAPDMGPQIRMTFENLELVLKDVGYGLADLISTRLYLVDYADFETVNAEYRRWLKAPFPARTTLQVAALPLGARVQIDATFHAAGVAGSGRR